LAQGKLCLCILNTEREVSFSQNGTCWHNTNVCHFYSGTSQFESWLRHWLFWSRNFIAFFYPTSMASTLKYVYNSIFSHLVFTVHDPVISFHFISCHSSHLILSNQNIICCWHSVKSDITKMKIINWKDCIRNRPKWKEFIEKAKTSLKL
jgi:hypothetical protein